MISFDTLQMNSAQFAFLGTTAFFFLCLLKAPSRKYLAPSLSDGASRPDKISAVMGLKKRNPRLQSSELVQFSVYREKSYLCHQGCPSPLNQWSILHIPLISEKFLNFRPIFVLFRFLASPLLMMGNTNFEPQLNVILSETHQFHVSDSTEKPC